MCSTSRTERRRCLILEIRGGVETTNTEPAASGASTADTARRAGGDAWRQLLQTQAQLGAVAWDEGVFDATIRVRSQTLTGPLRPRPAHAHQRMSAPVIRAPCSGMEQDHPADTRYQLDLTLTFRITDYPARSRACMDAALNLPEQPSDEFVAFLQNDPRRGIVDLAVQALQADMPGIDIQLRRET